jgi:Prenyltransferase and squalene oxidase repeat
MSDQSTSSEGSAAQPGDLPRLSWVGRWRRLAWSSHPLGAWFLSAALHGSILLVLGLLIRHIVKQSGSTAVEISAVRQPAEQLNDTPIGAPGTLHPGFGSSDFSSAPVGEPIGSALDESPAMLNLGGSPAAAPGIDARLSVDAATSLPQGNGGGPGGLASGKGGGGLGGRSPGRRGQLAKSGGGSAESEEAVERGLKWLLAHQHEDGGWRFSFDGAPCENLCRNPGTEKSTTGATAIALLPFYGAGYTHREGPYAEQVNRGLYYLCGRMLVTPQGGDLQEGTMYAQGLSTIVLCEAYAMSKDEKLRPIAQNAVNYIVYAQDKQAGGWRYFPGQAGDTTVTGWQLMALKSAQMAGLEVPSRAFLLADKFLDSVETEKGAAYGYLRPGEGPATNSVGLLCRMYLGWKRERRALMVGVTNLEKLGPSGNNLYFDYYATQVLFHYGGSGWDGWNKKLREYLISTQSKEGHENGSWYFVDSHGDKGGRLYNTAMAILTLEVYYRYLPLYSNRAVENGF